MLPLYTYIYLGFVGFYGLLFKPADILLLFGKQRSVFHAVKGMMVFLQDKLEIIISAKVECTY